MIAILHAPCWGRAGFAVMILSSWLFWWVGVNICSPETRVLLGAADAIAIEYGERVYVSRRNLLVAASALFVISSVNPKVVGGEMPVSFGLVQGGIDAALPTLFALAVCIYYLYWFWVQVRAFSIGRFSDFFNYFVEAVAREKLWDVCEELRKLPGARVADTKKSDLDIGFDRGHARISFFAVFDDRSDADRAVNFVRGLEGDVEVSLTPVTVGGREAASLCVDVPFLPDAATAEVVLAKSYLIPVLGRDSFMVVRFPVVYAGLVVVYAVSRLWL